MIFLSVIFSGCTLMEKTNKNIDVQQNNQVKMANPSSEYCVKNGGVNKIVVNKDGSEAGLCVFSDGSSCDEWKYFRGECSQGDSLVKYNWKF